MHPFRGDRVRATAKQDGALLLLRRYDDAKARCTPWVRSCWRGWAIPFRLNTSCVALARDASGAESPGCFPQYLRYLRGASGMIDSNRLVSMVGAWHVVVGLDIQPIKLAPW